MSLSPRIRSALDTQPDYGEAFAQRVARLGGLLSKRLGVCVTHRRDMNYRAAQSLELRLNAGGDVIECDDDAAAARVLVLVSSRGPLFTVVGLKRAGQRTWVPTDLEQIAGGTSLLQLVQEQLKSEGIEPVLGDILHDIVPGRTTEMDDAPATLMDVLFAEVI